MAGEPDHCWIALPFHYIIAIKDLTVKMFLHDHFERFYHNLRPLAFAKQLQVMSTSLPCLQGCLADSILPVFAQVQDVAIGDLIFEDRCLKQIPHFVCNMKLKVLKVLGKKEITEIPLEICTRLTSLKTLFINSCGLKSLPHNFGDLAALEHLELSGNCLEHLCDSFSRLVNLKCLKLSGNAFDALDKELPETLTKIRYLHLGGVCDGIISISDFEND